MNFLTDTHALLWHFTDSPKISQRAKEIFYKCEQGQSCVVVAKRESKLCLDYLIS